VRILDRYIGFTVAVSTFFVLLVLVSLFSFFTFAGELNKTGRGEYDSWQALQFAALTIPAMLYQIFPTAALIGTMSGLGALANNSELVAMRAAGYSLYNILRSVFIFSFILMLIVALVGEYVSPAAQTYAETKRSLALSGSKGSQIEGGVWLRDGSQFIHVGNIADDGRLQDVRMFQLTENQQLAAIKEVGNAANFDAGNWLLSDYTSYQVLGDDVKIEKNASVTDVNFLSQDILDLVAVKPESMSAQAAYQYVSYLEDNGIDARHYSQAFWMKVTAPIATFVMVMLAIPIVMGSLRTLTAGHRVLIGTLTGIGFYLVSQVFAYMGLVFELSPIVTAFVPILVFAYVAFRMMKRVT